MHASDEGGHEAAWDALFGDGSSSNSADEGGDDGRRCVLQTPSGTPAGPAAAPSRVPPKTSAAAAAAAAAMSSRLTVGSPVSLPAAPRRFPAPRSTLARADGPAESSGRRIMADGEDLVAHSFEDSGRNATPPPPRGPRHTPPAFGSLEPAAAAAAAHFPAPSAPAIPRPVSANPVASFVDVGARTGPIFVPSAPGFPPPSFAQPHYPAPQRTFAPSTSLPGYRAPQSGPPVGLLPQVPPVVLSAPAPMGLGTPQFFSWSMSIRPASVNAAIPDLRYSSQPLHAPYPAPARVDSVNVAAPTSRFHAIAVAPPAAEPQRRDVVSTRPGLPAGVVTDEHLTVFGGGEPPRLGVGVGLKRPLLTSVEPQKRSRADPTPSSLAAAAPTAASEVPAPRATVSVSPLLDRPLATPSSSTVTYNAGRAIVSFRPAVQGVVLRAVGRPGLRPPPTVVSEPAATAPLQRAIAPTPSSKILKIFAACALACRARDVDSLRAADSMSKADFHQFGPSLLSIAASFDAPECVQYLLEEGDRCGADMRALPGGRSDLDPLVLACFAGSVKVVELLLSRVDAPAALPTLSASVARGALDIAAAHLRAARDPVADLTALLYDRCGAAVPDERSIWLLLWALSIEGVAELASHFLLLHSLALARTPLRQAYGGTVSHYFAALAPAKRPSRFFELANPFFEAHDVQDDDGYTPLHIAASCGRADVVRELLRRGADPLVQSKSGISPFQFPAPQ